MKTVAIIPARGGSQRIPGKNIKVFHGKPIILYSIETAKQSKLFDRIIVTTDDDEISNVALNAGASVWRRKAKYARDEVGTQEVVAECLKGMGIADDTEVCCIYATAPLMDVDDLLWGYSLLNGGFDHGYVFSVGYPPLQDAGQFYWGMAGMFKADVPLIGPNTKMVHVDPKRVCDINTPEDWIRALLMYEELRK